MTVGATSKDDTVYHSYYIDGAYQGTIHSGKLETKTWTGGDSFTAATRPPGVQRFYTTLGESRFKGKSSKARPRVIKRSFRARAPRRSIGLLPNDYSMTAKKVRSDKGSLKITSRAADGSVNWVQNVSDYAISVDSPVLPTLPLWDVSDDYKLLEKLQTLTRGSDFNLANFIGAEGHDTLRMIGDSATKIAKAMSHVKRGNIIAAASVMTGSARDAAKLKRRLVRKNMWTSELRQASASHVSRTWLEMVYGWLPLLSDIRSGAQFLAHKLNVPAKRRYRVVHSVKQKTYPAGSFGPAEWHAIVAKQIVAYISEEESIPSLLGLTDPLTVLWNATPWSFVADWIAPIGDYLQVRGYASGLTGTFVTTATTRRSWSGYVGHEVKYPDGSTITGSDSSLGYSCSTITMDRVVSSTLAVPMPKVRPLGRIASWQHAANGIALLSQAARKGFSNPRELNPAPLPDRLPTWSQVSADKRYVWSGPP